MRIVQFEVPGAGRRVGVVTGEQVVDVTSVQPELQRVVDVFDAAQSAGRRLAEFLTALIDEHEPDRLTYDELLAATPGGENPFLHPPVDHVDPHCLLITGTGLTHTGGMKSRDSMHADEVVQTPKTDSMRMFEMGLEGGKPAAGERGVAPEWFYKGNGANLRGHRQTLQIPAFALDGGEEPELAGCYVIDREGTPRRLGFALGIEWSDHATERINYLYLAPSKLRQCSIGPELVTDCEFREVQLRCTIARNGETLYDSGELFSGEEHMCHSLANCEDHHFKYPQHRVPGDLHVHFFGTSKLSYSGRDWKFAAGDEICLAAPALCASLVNRVTAGDPSGAQPTRVEPA